MSDEISGEFSIDRPDSEQRLDAGPIEVSFDEGQTWQTKVPQAPPPRLHPAGAYALDKPGEHLGGEPPIGAAASALAAGNETLAGLERGAHGPAPPDVQLPPPPEGFYWHVDGDGFRLVPIPEPEPELELFTETDPAKLLFHVDERMAEVMRAMLAELAERDDKIRGFAHELGQEMTELKNSIDALESGGNGTLAGEVNELKTIVAETIGNLSRAIGTPVASISQTFATSGAVRGRV